jgi:predicted CoA-substrate-specific enzyme activase
MIYYVCKYTPVELLRGFGEETAVLDREAENFDLSDRAAHVNLCGFGKSVLEAALSGGVQELVLVNCCDVMRRVYDVLKAKGCCRFLFMLDLPHTDGECQRERFAREILRLRDEYAAYSGKAFDSALFMSSFGAPDTAQEPYVAIIGARAGREVQRMMRETCALPVRDLTCVGNRAVAAPEPGGDVFLSYAASLLSQLPCRRMADSSSRRALFEDPALRGIMYHTIKFCDYYGMEYAQAQRECAVPMARIETDYTRQSSGQLRTRVEAFAETIGGAAVKPASAAAGEYYAGVDSGSASTDAVIIDSSGNIAASCVLPTGGGARVSADSALSEALKKAGLRREQIARVVATGYGRAGIGEGSDSITEISCHAKGAHRLLPEARTVIDIGGQDSKAIRIDGNGRVVSFAMNDKCAAGTGRFLEMMARTLGLGMDEMSRAGLKWKENIVISSMCTVFAESEVVTLVAQNRSVDDIVHGLNNSVAAKIAALVSRVGGEERYIITGGVAQNAGVVRAVGEKLGTELYVCGEAQICGALGAALFAAGL